MTEITKPTNSCMLYYCFTETILFYRKKTNQYLYYITITERIKLNNYCIPFFIVYNCTITGGTNSRTYFMGEKDFHDTY